MTKLIFALRFSSPDSRGSSSLSAEPDQSRRGTHAFPSYSSTGPARFGNPSLGKLRLCLHALLQEDGRPILRKNRFRMAAQIGIDHPGGMLPGRPCISSHFEVRNSNFQNMVLTFQDDLDTPTPSLYCWTASNSRPWPKPQLMEFSNETFRADSSRICLHRRFHCCSGGPRPHFRPGHRSVRSCCSSCQHHPAE